MNFPAPTIDSNESPKYGGNNRLGSSFISSNATEIKGILKTTKTQVNKNEGVKPF